MTALCDLYPLSRSRCLCTMQRMGLREKSTESKVGIGEDMMNFILLSCYLDPECLTRKASQHGIYRRQPLSYFYSRYLEVSSRSERRLLT